MQEPEETRNRFQFHCRLSCQFRLQPPHPWAPAEILKREWPIVRATPITSIICFFAGCALILFLFSYFIIPGKDAQIHALEAKNGNLPPESRTNTPLKLEAIGPVNSGQQLYLKIRNIEIVPDSPINNPMKNPYRIVAHISGHSFSFPSGQTCYSGTVVTDDSIPLPMDESKYLIQFEREDINSKVFLPAPTNSSDSVFGGLTDVIEKTDQLPISKTNSAMAIKNCGKRHQRHYWNHGYYLRSVQISSLFPFWSRRRRRTATLSPNGPVDFCDQCFRLFRAEAAGNLRLSTGDFRLNDGGGPEFAIDNHGKALMEVFAGDGGKLYPALIGQRDFNLRRPLLRLW